MVNPNKRPTQSLVRNVARSQPNLHYGEMKEACRLKPKQLAAKLGLTEITTSEGKKMWFKDNGSKVLFVAHLDSVQSYYELDTVKFREDTWITCPTLDDRIGVYVGAYWLPKAGIKPDLLFTTDEEKMKSTGHYFAPPKDYNWMFMFDRKGEGAVAYQYENEQLRYKLGKHNIILQKGSYSCIKEMSHLKCIGINFGAGYEMNHSTYAYASKKVLERQLRKFRDFWDEFSTTKMVYEKPENTYAHFAETVNRHASEWRSSQNLNLKGSEDYGDYKKKQEELAKKHYGEYGPADSREVSTSGIIDTPFELIETAIPTLPAKDKQLTYQDVKTFVLVNKEGKLTNFIGTRNSWKLYWDIETLPIDKVLQNILRAQWKIRTLYDLCKVSAYTLVNSGYITAKDADIIRMTMVDAGFDMPMNVQGFKTPDQYQLQVAVGYRARASAVTGSIKPVPVEKRMMDVAARLDDAKKRLDVLSGKMKIMDEKRMDLFPLPNVDTTQVIQQSRELIKDGYDMRAYSQCKECLKQFQWDMAELDATPEFCPICFKDQDQNQLSLFPAIKKDDGADILTKIQLVKDKNDKTSFRYIGKVRDGFGIDRFDWIEQREFEKLKVGFC
jgi:hypothetical protein